MVEQAPGLRPGGQAVDARGAAKEVIRWTGLEAEVRAAYTRIAGAYTVDADGVDVAFASGDRRRFHLVIGATGWIAG